MVEQPGVHGDGVAGDEVLVAGDVADLGAVGVVGEGVGVGVGVGGDLAGGVDEGEAQGLAEEEGEGLADGREVALGKIPGDDLGDEAGVLREGLAGVADVGALEGAELVEEQPDGDGHEGQDAERDGEEDEVAVLEHGGSGGWGVGASAGHPRIR